MESTTTEERNMSRQIITQTIFSPKRDRSTPTNVTGPFRASDGKYDLYADGFLHSRHDSRREAQDRLDIYIDGEGNLVADAPNDY